MRIFDKKNNQTTSDLILFLTENEAQELISSLQQMIDDKKTHHAHINDESLEHELTVTLYDENIESFDERSKEVITKDV